MTSGNTAIDGTGVSEESARENEAELRAQSRSWTPEQWEAYLLTLECPRSEKLISPKRYDYFLETKVFDMFDLAQSNSSSALVDFVKQSLEILTPRERQVVELLFYKSKTFREASLELGVVISRIAALKANAIRKLRAHFIKRVNALTIVDTSIQNRDAQSE